jgi:dCMP deaminase
MDKRVPFDIMILKICNILAERSTCIKLKVGCALVKDGRIISTGWNGVLSKFKHCEKKEDCPRWDITGGTKYEIGDCQHAETAAILQAAKNGISTKDSVLYVNNTVCRICARNIVSAGIKKVVYIQSNYDGDLLLKKANIELVKYTLEDI